MMPEPDDHLDQRLRAALSDLDDAARERLHPVDVRIVSRAGRRRRTALSAGAAVLLLLVAGGFTSVWLMGPWRTERAAAPRCVAINATAFLRGDVTDEQRERVGAVLAEAPEVTASHHETRADAYENFRRLYADAPDLVDAVRPDTLPESWRFTLRCAGDLDAVRQRLALPGVDEVLPQPKRPPSPTR
jgi:cell division protein FtsX